MKPRTHRTLLALAVGTLAATQLLPATGAEKEAPGVSAVIDALELRAIGPAMMGGRIADIAVHPARPSTWFIAVGSGGVWKTDNAGITFTPVFDEQPSYSIGEVTIDPMNPNVVWVGTGENVSGRHVGWGDGVYLSRDGGDSWQAMGLERSEHIGRILVHPEDSNTILVAAEGPLWSSGGERGVYRSSDGGESWTRVLNVDENTGATDLEFHPGDPSIVYAATYERRRSVWSFHAGGPGSGIWKSTDGGVSWREVTAGLPSADDDVEIGKIGIAVTAADPDRVYATIEASDGEQGFFVSTDRGERWERRNEYISGGTGPHYYQEIEASPVDADRVYQMDVFMRTTTDGGRSFSILETGRDKHSDNHALWIDPSNPDHLLAGTDGGLYESFDNGQRWRHFPNLPISQFYKVDVSQHSPYYQVLAGAQDLGTLLGPARTLIAEGVRNQDWLVPFGADGYGVAFDPKDLDVFYQMYQNGNLVRYHAPSAENVTIKPQPAEGEPPERWNWDAPLFVSPHVDGRIYYGSQRLWRSDDRGSSWTPLSGDLTLGSNRFELPVGGRVRSTDALWDLGAMSRYASLTAIAESPIKAGRLWTGSDDGLVHTSADGGKSWRRVTPPALPERAFINAVIASQHEADGAFVVADNHKTGDYRPMIFATRDGGRSWRDISGDLNDGVLAWSIAQDDVEAGLLFLGAENGIYVSFNGGAQWQRLSAGVPTIPFRDLKLQRRDDDLVAASFGRGIYVLDDYAPLRAIAADLRAGGDGIPGNGEAALFPTRDAWWYLPSHPGQAAGLPSQGSDAWRAPNPPHGAVFTVYFDSVEELPKEIRRDRERELAAKGADIPFPGWEALAAEERAGATRYYLDIRGSSGETVRRLPIDAAPGAQRVSWDMRGAAPDAIDLEVPDFRPPWVSEPQGPLVAPDTYEARLLKVSGTSVAALGEAQRFRLVALDNLPEGNDAAAAAAFQAEVAELQRRLAAVDGALDDAMGRVPELRAAIDRTPDADPLLHAKLDSVAAGISRLKERLRGNPARRRLSEFTVPGVAGRVSIAASALESRMLPTIQQRDNADLAAKGLTAVEAELSKLLTTELEGLEQALHDAGAPWVPGTRAGGTR
ncbi:MAG: glycosyl hydrolase [Halieaceae bacterium]|jgi:photosystem II stability/assembly factor-like uncharacterized protein|nr:glycosyl hydrolase [Halieaceae bacterium]